MRTLLCLLLCGTMLHADDKVKDLKAPAEVKKTDDELIQGTWKTVQIDLGADGKLDASKLEGGGKSLTIFNPDNVLELKTREKIPAGTFKIGKDGDLKTLDMTIGGRDILCLYELDGDVLKLCYQQRPNSQRPKIFAADAKNYFAIFIMERVKEDKPSATEFFNGKDLTGWVNLNCGPKTWKVEKGELITSGTPYGLLRTEKMYENFEIEFEWMHINTKDVGNSGFFVWCDGLPQIGGPYTRGIEVQVLVNYPKNDWATNHGDVFSVSGAKCVPDRPHPTKKGLERCLPSEERCKGGGEWNHYKVVANDGAIKLHVNGKEVSGVSGCTPRKGYLAFESEGAECHYKNIKFKELPSTKPKKEEIAIEDRGFRPIFNHVDTTGWIRSGETWTVKNGTLLCTGNRGLGYKLPGKKTEVLFDWKGPENAGLLETAGNAVRTWPLVAKKAGAWQRDRVSLDASDSFEFNFADKLEIKNIYLREVPEEKK
jgi:uncharacterized protein (TIGR03067 family)